MVRLRSDESALFPGLGIAVDRELAKHHRAVVEPGVHPREQVQDEELHRDRAGAGGRGGAPRGVVWRGRAAET